MVVIINRLREADEEFEIFAISNFVVWRAMWSFFGWFKSLDSHIIFLYNGLIYGSAVRIKDR